LLNLAENCTHNFHNLLPFRGADVRDALPGRRPHEALQMWAARLRRCRPAPLPVWGVSASIHESASSAISTNRTRPDHPPDESRAHGHRDCETIGCRRASTAPGTRAATTHIRHNVKAIYQKYLGWYDANPSISIRCRADAGKKYVEYRARGCHPRARGEGFRKGEFRFVAQA